MKITIALLLLLFAFSNAVLGQDADPESERHALRVKMAALHATMIKLEKEFLATPNPCGDPKRISRKFREVAGDTFDKVLALETAELKGLLFYEPIVHEAELAVLKVQGKAANTDEETLAGCLEQVKQHATMYRSDTASWNRDQNAFKSLKSLDDETYHLHDEKYRRERYLEEDEKWLRVLEVFQKNLDEAIRKVLKPRP